MDALKVPKSRPAAPTSSAASMGTFVGIEVKGAKGELSEEQHEFKDCLEKAGGKYFVARSIDDVQGQGL